MAWPRKSVTSLPTNRNALSRRANSRLSFRACNTTFVNKPGITRSSSMRDRPLPPIPSDKALNDIKVYEHVNTYATIDDTRHFAAKEMSHMREGRWSNMNTNVAMPVEEEDATYAVISDTSDEEDEEDDGNGRPRNSKHSDTSSDQSTADSLASGSTFINDAYAAAADDDVSDGYDRPRNSKHYDTISDQRTADSLASGSTFINDDAAADAADDVGDGYEVGIHRNSKPPDASNVQNQEYFLSSDTFINDDAADATDDDVGDGYEVGIKSRAASSVNKTKGTSIEIILENCIENLLLTSTI